MFLGPWQAVDQTRHAESPSDVAMNRLHLTRQTGGAGLVGLCGLTSSRDAAGWWGGSGMPVELHSIACAEYLDWTVGSYPQYSYVIASSAGPILYYPPSGEKSSRCGAQQPLLAVRLKTYHYPCWKWIAVEPL